MSVALPEIPADLAGWVWRRTTDNGVLLEAPDGWKTKVYTQRTEKAIGEARRYKLSQPRAEKALGDAPADLEAQILATLPPVPDDLPGWRWEVSAAHGLRLANPEEGWATRWNAPDRESAVIVEARERVAADRAQVAADTLSPAMRAHVADVLDQADAFIARARAERAAAQAAPATAWQPGPDADGVFRRPPGMAEYTAFPPRDLIDGRWQPREAYEQTSLDELAASIKERGVTTPLLAVINELGEPELIAGHRRKRAALAAGGRDVPVRVLEVTAAQAFEIAMTENDQRSDLTDLERGRGYEKMIAELGISEAKLAERLGRPRAYIQQRRMLAGAAPELQAATTSGELSFTQARAICLGSGGDHPTQKAVTAYALKQIKAERPETATQLQARAERTVRERSEELLVKLGWKRGSWWMPKTGTDVHFFYAKTAKPANWSSAEILAAAREGRRPPAQGAPASLGVDDRLMLERVGWEVDAGRCAPWLLARRDTEMLAGDATDLAAAIAAARQYVGQLEARFVAQGWNVTWTKTALRAVPPSDGAKKKLTPVQVQGGEIERLIDSIEKGTYTPEKKLRQGYDNSFSCPTCGTKVSSGSQYVRINGKYQSVCLACADQAQVAERAERKALAVAVEAQIGAWLDAAPPAAMAILAANVSGREASTPRAAALSALADSAWRYRDELSKAGHVFTPPATAVAPPPVGEPPAPAPALTFTEITASLDQIAERWQRGDRAEGDRATLEQLGDVLDDLVAELEDAAYEGTIARIGMLLARLDEEETIDV